MALAVKAWSPARCREAFTELARDAFSVRKVTKYLGPSALHRGTLACMLGSLYPAQGLERALRRCFGATTPIDDCRSAAVENGVYVAVTTTTVPGSEPRLLTNYNGIGQRSDGDGESAKAPGRSVHAHELIEPAHRVITVPDPSRTLTLWERCVVHECHHMPSYADQTTVPAVRPPRLGEPFRGNLFADVPPQC